MARQIRFRFETHPGEIDRAVASRLTHMMHGWLLSTEKRSWFSQRPFTIGIGSDVRHSDLIIHAMGDPEAQWPQPVGLAWGISESPGSASFLRMPAYAPESFGLDANVFTVTRDLRLSERPRILYLGSYGDGAGLSIFFAAMKSVLAYQGEAVLLGGLDYRDRLAPVVAKLNLASKIIFAPSLTARQLSGLYRSADILVCPDRDTRAMYRLIDVYAHGLPVILRDMETVRQTWGYPALLVEDNDTGSWVQAIQEAIQNSRLREELIRRAVEFAEPHRESSVASPWLHTIEDVSGQDVISSLKGD